MGDSDIDEFILIDVNDNNGKVQQQVMFDNAQLTHSIINDSNNLNVAGSTHSIDGWSEITAPSVRSINSNQRQGIIFISIYLCRFFHPSIHKLIQLSVSMMFLVHF